MARISFSVCFLLGLGTTPFGTPPPPDPESWEQNDGAEGDSGAAGDAGEEGWCWVDG
jgi:hypothetical protein